jgi:integrase
MKSKYQGEYQKTNYPGIFKYVGEKKTVYGIDYYAGGKKHREMVGGLLGDAKNKLKERQDQAKQGIVIQKKNTFRKLAQEYSKLVIDTSSYQKSEKYYIGYWEKQENGTESWKDMTLTQYFGDRKLFQVTPKDIEEYKKLRKDTLVNGKERSGVSVNRELEVLRHMLNKAIEWQWLEKNPFSVFKESVFYGEDNSRARYLKPDEMIRLFDVLEKSPSYLKNIIKGAIFTGLRKGDLLKLQWKDIDKEKGFLTYLEQKKRNGRNKEPKWVVKHLNGDMIDLLNEMPVIGEYVFCQSDGKPLKNVIRAFKTALKRAGVTDFHFHDLRHTSASYLLMRGAPLVSVQKHLNHKDFKMTQRYAHLAEQFQKEQVNKLNGLFDEIENGNKMEANRSKKLVRSDQNEGLKGQPNVNVTA